MSSNLSEVVTKIYLVDDSLGFLIYRADLKIKSRFQRQIKSYGITREQWAIIGRLFDQDGISQKDLSEQTLKDQAAVTRILDGMESKGLVKRHINQSDRRSFLVYLTDSGKELREQVVPIAVSVLKEATEGLTENEVHTLKKLLRKVVSNVE
ncbi:MAG: MarR family transcriptional regulator [Firmicutes bacterium]|nr:MarR family transcriptional regulator [Bacillota bacterium]